MDRVFFFPVFIARPENNAKNSAPQSVNYCVTDFVVPRYAFKFVPCNSRSAALPFLHYFRVLL